MTGKGLSILIIDDDQIAQYSLKRNLEELGYNEIYFAHSVDQIVHLVSNLSIDMVIWDAHMHDSLHSAELIDLIKQREVVLIVQSPLSKEDMLHKTQISYYSDYLQKPYKYSSVGDVVTKWSV